MSSTAKKLDITVVTSDGQCRAKYFTPDRPDKVPGVVVLMDGLGFRSALFAMGERLAKLGYAVLLPDLFYRAGLYEALDPKVLFSDVEKRTAWFGTYFASLSQAGFLRDMTSFLSFLDRQPEVDTSRKIGVTGYCMGGGLAIAAAGTFPKRIGLAASFHGSKLATDAPESPHFFAPRIKAFVYVAGATEDADFPNAMKERLDAALTAAAVPHKVETYEWARHGWVPSDTPVHNPEAAERHWTMLESLLASKL